MSLSNAHAATKALFYSLTDADGLLLFPEPGQVMFAPQLNQAVVDDPQGAVNKIGFAFQGTDSETASSYLAELQCLLTYPETKSDDEFLGSLRHADEFLKALNLRSIDGVGTLSRFAGPTPVFDLGILGVQLFFSVTAITID